MISKQAKLDKLQTIRNHYRQVISRQERALVDEDVTKYYAIDSEETSQDEQQAIYFLTSYNKYSR